LPELSSNEIEIIDLPGISSNKLIEILKNTASTRVCIYILLKKLDDPEKNT